MRKEDIYSPDYERGIFRLLPTLLKRSLKKDLPADYEKWVMEDANFIQETDIVLIVILDALGAEQYKGEFLEELWEKSGKKKLSSVFPSATSNALGSIFLGTPPEENGLVSVRFFVDGIGNFINSLKASVLGKGENSLPENGVNPSSFLWKDPLPEKMRDEIPIVRFLEKQYKGGLSRFFGRKEDMILVGNEIDMFSSAVQAIKEIAENDAQTLQFLYIPLLDTLGHSYGPESQEWKRGANFINREIKRFIENITTIAENYDKDIGLFITADHGMTKIDHIVELEQEKVEDVRHNQYIRGIMQSGRPSFSYLTNKSIKKAKEKITTAFKDRYTPYEIEEVADSLWPCLNDNIKRFKKRIGSIVSLPAPHTEFRTKQERDGLFSTLGWGRVPFKGSHGGATKEEIEVPLIYSYFGK